MLETIKDWVDLATVIGGFATAFAAALAIVGIPLVYVQIRANKEIQREAIAKALYREYLEDAVTKPDLVVPNLEELKNSGRFIQYELFVAHMLYSLEEILTNVSGDGWKYVVQGQLKRHLEYLLSDDFKVKLIYYDKKLISLIEELEKNSLADEESKVNQDSTNLD